MRNAYCVARLKQLQRSLAVDSENRVLNMRVGRGVRAARHQFIPSVDDLAPAAIDRSTLHHDHIARLRHREVRLRRHDHSKGLQVGVCLHVRVAIVIEGQLAQIDRTPLRRHGPRNIGQEFESKLSRVFQPLKLGVDLEVGFLAFDLGFARGALQQVGPTKIHLGRPALQPVVHSLGGARDRGRGENTGIGGNRALRLCRRQGCNGNDEDRNGQRQFFHKVLDLGEIRTD